VACFLSASLLAATVAPRPPSQQRTGSQQKQKPMNLQQQLPSQTLHGEQWRRLQPQPQQWDVVVYGATPGGCAAAIAAARANASTILVEPTAHVGGLTAGGLGNTDLGLGGRELGGITAEFYARLSAHYTGLPIDPATQCHMVESGTAERLYRTMLVEAGVQVVTDARVVSVARRTAEGRVAALNFATATMIGAGIQGPHGFRRASHSTVATVPTGDNGDNITGHHNVEDSMQQHQDASLSVLAGRYFIDGSYEGDLLPLFGVSWTTGRESADRCVNNLCAHVALKPPPPHSSLQHPYE